MIDVLQYGKFKTIGKERLKKQIILCHTGRDVDEYITSLKFRYNGKYDKIPNYIITREGQVLQLLTNDSYSRVFDDESIDKKSIIVSLENLGWLEKKPLNTSYINWKGSIYNKSPYEKKWRDFFFWEPYTEKQIDSVVELCEIICNEMSIKKQTIGHNTKIEGIKNFEGIVSRSNYDSRFTDLNPSFNFEKFEKIIENEQTSR